MNTFQVARPSSINRVQKPLTLEAVRTIAPSAFAPAPHESRSSRYAYIPTSEVITALMREGFQPFSAVQSRTRVEGKQDFTKHMIRFRHVSTDIARQVGDVVPEVAVMNSHDGSSSYWLMEAMYRLTCLNGMFVSQPGGQTLKVNHTGKIIDQVIEGSYSVIDRSVKAIDVVEDWNRLQLTSGDAASFCRCRSQLALRQLRGRSDHAHHSRPAARAASSRNGCGLRSVATLNVVQENVIKGGLHAIQRTVDERGRVTRRNVTTRQVNGIDQDVRLNRALWMLAEKMAELKTRLRRRVIAE